METMETIFSPRFDYVCHSPRTHLPRTNSPRAHSPKTHPPRAGSPRRRRGEKSNCIIFEHQENGLDNGIMYSPHNIGGGMEDINFFDSNREKRFNHKHRGRGKDDTSFSHNHCGKRVENGKCHNEHHEAPVCTRKNSESNEIPIAYRKCKKRKCDVCYPKVTDYYDLNKSIDPVLFVRWEVKRTPNNSMTLQRVKYNINGLGQVLRSVERPKKGKIKEGAEAIKAKVRVRLDTLKGQKIIARRDQDGLYYPAVVLRCSDPRHAVIKYEGGEEANVLTRNMIPVGGAVARPPLSVGDYVLVRVVYLDTKDECYIPAVIRAEPKNQSMAAKFYSVVMYNGQKATTLRKFLVKISKERFELASMYIAEQHNESREETQDSVYVSPRRTKEKVQKKRPDDKKKHIRSTSRSSDDEEQHSFRPKRRSRRSPSVSDDSRSRSRSASSRSRSRSNSPRSRSKSPKNRSRSKSPKTRSKSSRSRSRSNSPIPVLKPTKSSTARSDSDSNDSERSRSREYDKSQGHSSRKSRSRSGSSGSDDGRKSPGEVQSETSLSARSELRRLRAELVRHQEKQEKQKKKLKKMSRKLARQKRKMKDVSFREESPSAEPIAIPGAEDEGEAKHPRLIELRKSLQHLRPGEEVLARWSDDGWYYRGIVKHYHGDYSYNVEDSAEGMERIWRENIISENDDPSKVYEIGNRVVALHPDYSFSYAPGTIQEVSDSEVGVEFYDGQFCWLPWNEAYHSSPEKYDDDVQFIVRKETELVGAACVARHDKTGAFYPGTVTKRCGSGRDYMIQWADGSESKQTAIHIFSAFTRRPHLNIGNRVLACADPVHLKFLPGYLAGKIGDKLIVKFCDGETRKDIDPALCYWLGQIYYDTVVKYYKSHDPSFY